jgi:hypothetical protein
LKFASRGILRLSALKLAGVLPIRDRKGLEFSGMRAKQTGVGMRETMARTRLRGLEIGGIQIGIEVPETCDWDWPDGPVADFQCLPRDPEVHVGVRVGQVGDEDLGGECYAIGSWTFEVARRGTDWQLGLSRGGRRAQLALFDREFRTGEVVLSQEAAMSSAYPLRGPLDEWIILHRTVARGGLCLTASAIAEDGEAILRLGVPDARSANRWATPSSSLLGRHAVLVREDRRSLRLFRTPWSESIDPRLGYEARVHEIHSIETAENAFNELLDPGDAAELLVTHAVVPLCDDSLLDRVLRNAQRFGQSTRVREIGETASMPAPMAWGSTQLQAAFAPPRSIV